MAEPPSHEELARRWLALWQDQFVAAASDPALAAAAARLLTLMGAAMAPWTAVAEAAARSAGERRTGNEDRAPAPAESARPETASAPPDDRGDALAHIARRLGAIEERLAELEAGARRDRPRPPIATRRRRS